MSSEENAPVDPNPDSGGAALPPEDPTENAPRVETVEDVASAAGALAGASLADREDEGEEAEEYDEDDENPMSALPPYVLKRVEKLLELNTKRDEIMEGYLKERAALEAKFQGLCQPLYEKRSEIIRGAHDDEIAKEDQVDGAEEDGAGEAPSEKFGEKAVGVPQFWVCAMGHMEAVAESVTEEDVDCLEHLENVTCEDDLEGTGFTLRFYFSENDYFENDVLTKRYEVPNLLLADEPILQNVEGCKIMWKEGKSLTHRTVKKKQRGKGKNAGQIRTVTKKERAESFFHFFEPPKMPAMEEMDEDEADRLEEAFDSDYDIAQAFRSHIIPKAVLWFTGKAMEEEMAEMLTPAQMEAFAAQAGAAGVSPFPPSAPGEQPPECKQN